MQSHITYEKRISPKRPQYNKLDFIQREHQKGFKAYLTRRLIHSAGDQSVKHMIDKHQCPESMNQVSTTFLPVMIRLPNESCKSAKLVNWMAIECAVVLAEDRMTPYR